MIFFKRMFLLLNVGFMLIGCQQPSTRTTDGDPYFDGLSNLKPFSGHAEIESQSVSGVVTMFHRLEGRTGGALEEQTGKVQMHVETSGTAALEYTVTENLWRADMKMQTAHLDYHAPGKPVGDAFQQYYKTVLNTANRMQIDFSKRPAQMTFDAWLMDETKADVAETANTGEASETSEPVQLGDIYGGMIVSIVPPGVVSGGSSVTVSPLVFGEVSDHLSSLPAYILAEGDLNGRPVLLAAGKEPIGKSGKQFGEVSYTVAIDVRSGLIIYFDGEGNFRTGNGSGYFKTKRSIELEE